MTYSQSHPTWSLDRIMLYEQHVNSKSSYLLIISFKELGREGMCQPFTLHLAHLLFLQALTSASAPITKVFGAFMSATNEYFVRLIFISCSVAYWNVLNLQTKYMLATIGRCRLITSIAKLCLPISSTLSPPPIHFPAWLATILQLGCIYAK